eukprot:3685642-Pleurochrysis_carterae.AAC.2
MQAQYRQVRAYATSMMTALLISCRQPRSPALDLWVQQQQSKFKLDCQCGRAGDISQQKKSFK